MALEVAVITGLAYKGTTLQDWANGIHFEVREGRPRTSPEVRGSSWLVPGRRGLVYGNRVANRLAIGLDGFLRGGGATEEDQRDDAESKLQTYFALFDVEDGPGELECVTPDGVHWVANAYPEVFLPPANPDVPSFLTVSVRLIAEDPPEWTVGS